MISIVSLCLLPTGNKRRQTFGCKHLSDVCAARHLWLLWTELWIGAAVTATYIYWRTIS